MRSRGLTMVEMLVVMTITAILVLAAIPSFDRLIRSTRISSAANSLLAALDVARSEAIRRNVVVTVCRSLNPEAPVDTADCSNNATAQYPANDWAAGWIVIAKNPLNADNAVWEAGDDLVLRQQPFQVPSARRLVVALNAERYSYASNGITVRDGQPLGFTATVDYGDPQALTLTDLTRCLAVNMTGRAATYRRTGATC